MQNAHKTLHITCFIGSTLMEEIYPGSLQNGPKFGNQLETSTYVLWFYGVSNSLFKWSLIVLK